MKEIKYDSLYFNDRDTLECGQVFRYRKCADGYLLFSGDKACFLHTDGAETTITCDDENADYFYNYFDLSTDYRLINNRAMSTGFDILKKAADIGRGVRILRQDATEMLFSFLISQNNNIPRIKGIIEKICSSLGEKRLFNGEEYYTFPKTEELKKADLEFYKSVGLGYRAEFFKLLADMVDDNFIQKLSNLNGSDIKKELLKIKGVGDKVADCARLFGFYKTDSFPVDVWIEKIYREDFCGTEKTREKISEYFIKTFGSDSGYFQQYLFHYKRNIEGKNQ